MESRDKHDDMDVSMSRFATFGHLVSGPVPCLARTL